MACCTCNGVRARCICVKNGTSCVSCLPRKSGSCSNTLQSRQEKGRIEDRHLSVWRPSDPVDPGDSVDRSKVWSNKHSSQNNNHINQNLTSTSVAPSERRSFVVDNDSLSADGRVNVDDLMVQAFGAKFEHNNSSINVDEVCVWNECWKKIVQLQGKQYDLPGGAIGRKYVELLSKEVTQLACGNYPADRFIVFCAVVLQRDRMIRKGNDIRRVLERRMAMWCRGEYDQLIQEAVRCDKLLKNSNKRDFDDQHIVKIFTRLMLKGNVRAVVRWLSEKGRCKVLNHNEVAPTKNKEGSVLFKHQLLMYCTRNIQILKFLLSRHC